MEVVKTYILYDSGKGDSIEQRIDKWFPEAGLWGGLSVRSRGDPGGWSCSVCWLW